MRLNFALVFEFYRGKELRERKTRLSCFEFAFVRETVLFVLCMCAIGDVVLHVSPPPPHPHHLSASSARHSPSALPPPPPPPPSSLCFPLRMSVSLCVCHMRLATAPGPTVHWLFRSHDLPSELSTVAR